MRVPYRWLWPLYKLRTYSARDWAREMYINFMYWLHDRCSTWVANRESDWRPHHEEEMRRSKEKYMKEHLIPTMALGCSIKLDRT